MLTCVLIVSIRLESSSKTRGYVKKKILKNLRKSTVKTRVIVAYVYYLIRKYPDVDATDRQNDPVFSTEFRQLDVRNSELVSSETTTSRWR